MKKKWKIILGISVSMVMLFFILAFLSIFMMLRNMAPSPTVISDSPSPDLSPYPDPPSPPPSNNVDKLLNKMEFGAIAFNAPSNININDSSQIQLLLSLTETIEEMKQSINREGEKIGASIRVNDRMEARLTGYMFQITAITPEIQAVSKSHETEWRWEIHPKKEGKHSLHLTLTALLEVDGHSTPRAIRTFDKDIEVTVTKTQKFMNFFKNNWQWLWAAILVPIVGWLWKRKKAANKANLIQPKQKAARLISDVGLIKRLHSYGHKKR